MQNTVLTILTRSTTGPVNFYFIFAVFHTELLMHSQEIQHSKHLIFQIVQYTEYHCIRVQRIPASKSTSTKQLLFLISVLHYSHPKSKFQFWQHSNTPHVSTNRESDWKLAKFYCLPFTSWPVNHSIFRTEAFGEILLGAPPISPYRSFQPISYSVYLMFYRLLHRQQCSDWY